MGSIAFQGDQQEYELTRLDRNLDSTPTADPASTYQQQASVPENYHRGRWGASA
jgi:hypothetical protein